MGELEEVLLCLLETSLHGLDRVLREFGVPHHHLVELVSQEISALCTTMAIIDSKEGASGPEVDLLELRLDDVENDRDAIFIVVSDHALVGVCGIRDNNSILL